MPSSSYIGYFGALELLAGLGLFVAGSISSSRARAALARAEVEWQEAQRKWQALYYCQRDDCIFDPLEQRAVPSHQTNDYVRGRC